MRRRQKYSSQKAWFIWSGIDGRQVVERRESSAWILARQGITDLGTLLEVVSYELLKLLVVRSDALRDAVNFKMKRRRILITGWKAECHSWNCPSGLRASALGTV